MDVLRRVRGRLDTIHLEPQNVALFRLLDEISIPEDEAGRGLLAALVVRKTGDKMPGKGYFKFAESRGRDTTDPVACWAAELATVYESWSAPKVDQD